MKTLNELKKVRDGQISDELNPLFILQGVATDLLSQAVKGEFSLLDLARYELAGRGLDESGKWVGFPAAEKIHGIAVDDVKQTLAARFIALATVLMPQHDDLQDLDVKIDDAGQIDEIMFRKSEYLGGMAAVILELIK